MWIIWAAIAVFMLTNTFFLWCLLRASAQAEEWERKHPLSEERKQQKTDEMQKNPNL